jgi:hypothetical protein
MSATDIEVPVEMNTATNLPVSSYLHPVGASTPRGGVGYLLSASALGICGGSPAWVTEPRKPAGSRCLSGIGYATHNRSYQCRDVMLWLGVSLAASLRDATLALLHGGDLTSFSPPQQPARGSGLRNVLPSPVCRRLSANSQELRDKQGCRRDLDAKKAPRACSPYCD